MSIPVIGSDVTTSLASKTYLTANIGFLDGELIIQQKVMESNKLGLALGGFYRAERRNFEITKPEHSTG